MPRWQGFSHRGVRGGGAGTEECCTAALFPSQAEGFSTCGVVNKTEQHIIFPVIHSYAGCGEAELCLSGMCCEQATVGPVQFH